MTDAPKPADWRPMAELPPRQGYINVRSVTAYRWLPYRRGAPKNLLARGGRWQRATEYGWENADLPSNADWTPNEAIRAGATKPEET